MTNDEIKEFVSGILPSASFEVAEWININIEPGEWYRLAKLLQAEPFNFDYLFCLTCIDWKTHLTMVYHLSSTRHRQTIVLKAKLDRGDPLIGSVADIWRTADFHEREVYDLFGVKFNNHPDLRRLILTDDFEGYPLRKDFEDPINMIKL